MRCESRRAAFFTASSQSLMVFGLVSALHTFLSSFRSMATLEAHDVFWCSDTQTWPAQRITDEFCRVVEHESAGVETKLAPSTTGVGEDTLKGHSGKRQWNLARAHASARGRTAAHATGVHRDPSVGPERTVAAPQVSHATNTSTRIKPGER